MPFLFFSVWVCGLVSLHNLTKIVNEQQEYNTFQQMLKEHTNKHGLELFNKSGANNY